ncbi:hypothetical protein L873DRAFT_1828976 [Choiromyces venosus 120613-1]|uniref:DUF7732 domain-containing protein n=1 Tax=Choiromyces venosus 120613-1 TaxID=1336337 RepID=A0A3N4JMA7_9PEZI|nr:hypothetical protein L873DRAFT_1828976 [Choiromyces venosus 120613-1]
MKISSVLLSIALLSISSYTATNVNAVAVSRSGESSSAFSIRDILGGGLLEKRRGGGAGGGGGGRGGGGGGGGSSSSGGRSSSSSGSGGSSSSSGSGGSSSSSGSRGSTSSSSSSSSRSNSGGTTKDGSGRSPTYGRTRSYSGGAAVPYTSGRRTPRGILPFLLPLALLSFFPGLWLFSVFAYSWPNLAEFYNATSLANETISVLCLCQQYSVCGCEENTERTYIDQVISEAERNSSVARIVDVNGTETLVINGTLPNGTTAAEGTASVAGMGMGRLAGETLGIWVIAGVVAWGVFLS